MTSRIPPVVRRHRILVCPPEHFTVEYAINPWMEGHGRRPDREEAGRQWRALRDALARTADVVEMPAAPGVPDLVFTANSGLVCGRQVVLSHFRHPERRAEEPINRTWFAANGFEVIEMPAGLYFEGAGDGLWDRGGQRLWLGYGLRSTLEAGQFVAERLGVEVVPLRLVDPRFYHLDTCFCPLDGGFVLYYPEAFHAAALDTIERLVPAERRHAVSREDAFAFACNAVDTGHAVVLHDCSAELERVLHDWGFDVVRTPLGEFHLSGGSAKCLSLRLDEESAPDEGHEPWPLAAGD